MINEREHQRLLQIKARALMAEWRVPPTKGEIAAALNFYLSSAAELAATYALLAEDPEFIAYASIAFCFLANETADELEKEHVNAKASDADHTEEHPRDRDGPDDGGGSN